jgi:hypothetical protein
MIGRKVLFALGLDGEVHVILEITPELQADPGTLNKIHIKSPISGQQIPLSTVTGVKLSEVLGHLARTLRPETE